MATVALLSVASLSCRQKVETDFKVNLKYVEVDAARGTQWVVVEALAGQEWTLSLSDASGASVSWAALDPPYGTGSKSSVTITWEENDTGEPRVVVITGVCGSQTATVILTQHPESGSGGGSGTLPEEIIPDKVQ